jgi:hypothetical protein
MKHFLPNHLLFMLDLVIVLVSLAIQSSFVSTLVGATKCCPSISANLVLVLLDLKVVLVLAQPSQDTTCYVRNSAN